MDETVEEGWRPFMISDLRTGKNQNRLCMFSFGVEVKRQDFSLCVQNIQWNGVFQPKNTCAEE